MEVLLWIRSFSTVLVHLAALCSNQTKVYVCYSSIARLSQLATSILQFCISFQYWYRSVYTSVPEQQSTIYCITHGLRTVYKAVLLQLCNLHVSMATPTILPRGRNGYCCSAAESRASHEGPRTRCKQQIRYLDCICSGRLKIDTARFYSRLTVPYVSGQNAMT